MPLSPAFLTPEYCDEQYNPSRSDVPEIPTILQRWSGRSAETRASLPGSLDVRYGPTDDETIDVFPAHGASRALMMFIHGGYWTFADKADFTFLAPPYVAKGVTFALANYALAPKVRLEEIVEQCRRAAVWLYRNAETHGADPNRIYVCGHSSGGHLAMLLMATDWRAYGQGLPPDLVRGGLSVSGVHDLEPIRRAGFLNSALQLDEARTRALSPIAHRPATGAPLYLAVGGREKAEFLRQTRVLGERWASALKEQVPMPEANHFTIVDELANASGPLFAATLRMMGIND